MKFVLSRPITKNAKYDTARLKYTIIINLYFVCEDVFKPFYREHDYNKSVVTNAGTLLSIFELELELIKKNLNILSKNIDAQRVLSGLESGNKDNREN